MKRIALLTAMSLAVAPLATAAPAKPRVTAAVRAKAKAHIERGETLYTLHRFDEALVEYQAAYELEPLPSFLVNIAQCLRNLGRFDEALFTLRRYLRVAPKAHDRAKVEELIAKLEAEVERQAEEQRAAAAAREAEEARQAELTRRTLDASLAKPHPVARRTPVYRRWWFITGAVITVGATTAAILVATSGLPDGDLAPIDFSK